MPAARDAGAGQIAHGALERRDGVGRRAAAAELVEREQRDVHVGIAGGGERRRTGIGVVALAQAAQCLQPDNRGIVSPAGSHDAVQLRGRDLRRRGRRGAQRQPADLRVGIMRGGTQGIDVDQRGAGQRFEGEAAHARAGDRFTLGGNRQAPQHRHRVLARRASFALRSNECLETLRHTQSIGDRLSTAGHVHQHPLRGFSLGRSLVRQAAERIAERLAHVGLRLDLQPRGEGIRSAVDRRRCRRREP